jgi:hypothetical protein
MAAVPATPAIIPLPNADATEPTAFEISLLLINLFDVSQSRLTATMFPCPFFVVNNLAFLRVSPQA